MYLQASRESRFDLYVICVFFSSASAREDRILENISNAPLLPTHTEISYVLQSIYLYSFPILNSPDWMSYTLSWYDKFYSIDKILPNLILYDLYHIVSNGFV